MNVDKDLKQTFRLLKEVVRETKLRACPFSESGRQVAWFFPMKEQLIMIEKIPHSSLQGIMLMLGTRLLGQPT